MRAHTVIAFHAVRKQLSTVAFFAARWRELHHLNHVHYPSAFADLPHIYHLCFRISFVVQAMVMRGLLQKGRLFFFLFTKLIEPCSTVVATFVETLLTISNNENYWFSKIAFGLSVCVLDLMVKQAYHFFWFLINKNPVNTKWTVKASHWQLLH